MAEMSTGDSRVGSGGAMPSRYLTARAMKKSERP